MAVTLDTYAPFDTGAGANVTEDTWRLFMRHMLGSASGVIRGFDNELSVTGDDTGMQVKVATGEAWVRGHYGRNTSVKALPIAAAHATLARYDRVVIRANFGVGTKRVELDVITGTPAASPAIPTLTQSSAMWEQSLGIVNVPAADTSIGPAQVTKWRAWTTAHMRLYQSGTQNIATGTPVKLAFGSTSASSDDGSDDTVYFDSTNNWAVLVRPGLYSIDANALIAANATGRRWLYVARNGEQTTNRLSQQILPAAATGATALHVHAQDRFAAGAQVAIWVEQDSGGTRTTDISQNGTNASFMWVGP